MTLLITAIHMPGNARPCIAHLILRHDPGASIIYTKGRADALDGVYTERPHGAVVPKPYQLNELMRLVKPFYPQAVRTSDESAVS